MKIGILTHPLETNYGGILQAFALQKVLRDMGHDVLTIDRHNPRYIPSGFHHLLSFFKRLKQFYLDGKRDVSICWDPRMSEEEYKIISQHTRSFVEKNMLLTRNIFTQDLQAVDKEYKFDAYVVGSDQVWLPGYALDSFLSFVERSNVIKIFYAASTGRLSWNDNENISKKCCELVKDFRAVSVREASLLSLSHKTLGVEAVQVLDPTMLLSPKDYLDIIDLEPNKDVLFSYVLDETEEKRKTIENVISVSGLRHVGGNVPKKYVKRLNVNLDACIYPPIDNWINGFNNASFVITDSFHGSVFSILFNKPFAVVLNKSRGVDRFISLLEMFGLENRIVQTPDQARACFSQPIDFSIVNSRLVQWRNKSISFLQENLKN